MSAMYCFIGIGISAAFLLLLRSFLDWALRSSKPDKEKRLQDDLRAGENIEEGKRVYIENGKVWKV